ncbi:type IVB secretion system protein IcmW [Microbulbifer epialgicus]|uniref:Uncharacterized protein n=1 Tax=Microbulbifer epialgicus TaxID=393907 RepID=A0ABV4NTG6_9GAMM
MSRMIDLQDKEINDHWDKVEEGISNILENMQKKETWALDNNEEIKSALIKWAANVSDGQLEELVANKMEPLIKVFAFTGCRRALYLLHKLEERVPGATHELLMESVDTIDAGIGDVRPSKIIRDRLVALFRVDLLERVFSEERSEKIKTAIQYTTEAHGGIYG